MRYRASCRVDDEEAAEEARKQAQREADQREKEDFEARLRARDDEKTRKLMEARMSKEEMKARAAYLVNQSCLVCRHSSVSSLWQSLSLRTTCLCPRFST